MTTDLVLTDGGLETSLVFHQGLDLPCFAAFPLLADADGREALRRYFAPFLALAGELGLPFVLDTPTWRASRPWGAELGLDEAAVARANRDAVAFARELAGGRPGVQVNGVLGPRGDGYVPGEVLTPEAFAEHHAWQAGVLAEAGVDRLTGVTLTTPQEAEGVVRAAVALGVPVVAGVTVELDGRLPDGTPLAEAIERVDEATGGAAEGFLVNCAHPGHIEAGLQRGADVLRRVVALRPNASRCSHEELDAATELDEGDPVALGRETAALRALLPEVRVVGGCCGTDHRHVAEIARAWGAVAAPA